MSAVAYAGWMAAVCLAGGASALRLRLSRHAELVADAGHELRGPLCAARLGLHGLDDAERAAAVDHELRRAALALEDLVAASRGRRSSARPELVDVGALLDDGAEAWRPLAAAFGVSLSVEPLRGRAMVRADRARLAQACGNLVANAVEHGASPVRVRGRVVAGRVRVEVSDAGPGLPEPVSRVVARRRRGGGARGRGLAIAARIAEADGGRLSSAPSARGACLVLELPSVDLWPEPFQYAGSPPPGPPSSRRPEPFPFPGAPPRPFSSEPDHP
jgi:signal transduction histidine kinase